jgi:hypothetical protein
MILNWNTHINQVVKKANNTRVFLQRNIYRRPRKDKDLCYKIRSSWRWDASSRLLIDLYTTQSSANSRADKLFFPSPVNRNRISPMTLPWGIPDYTCAVWDLPFSRSINNLEEASHLQEDLERLQAWENDWLMEFHPNKYHEQKKTDICQPYGLNFVA